MRTEAGSGVHTSIGTSLWVNRPTQKGRGRGQIDQYPVEVELVHLIDEVLGVKPRADKRKASPRRQ